MSGFRRQICRVAEHTTFATSDGGCAIFVDALSLPPGAVEEDAEIRAMARAGVEGVSVFLPGHVLLIKEPHALLEAALDHKRTVEIYGMDGTGEAAWMLDVQQLPVMMLPTPAVA